MKSRELIEKKIKLTSSAGNPAEAFPSVWSQFLGPNPHVVSSLRESDVKLAAEQAVIGQPMRPPSVDLSPIKVKVDGKKYQYKCRLCSETRGSSRGMDAHIRKIHTGEKLRCDKCEYFTYNKDSLLAHTKNCPMLASIPQPDL